MPCPKDYDRVDKNGRAKAGSQKQIQIYVNERETAFSERVMEVLEPSMTANTTLRWVSPLAKDNFNEYRDSEFLDKLGLTEHSKKLQGFWPRRGPCWDALAVVDGPGFHGVLLVEAKSHITEMKSKCGAKSRGSLDKIQKALALTAQSLGVDMNSSWKEDYYQTANRYAHLHLLRSLGVPVWLVNVYFINDNVGVKATTFDEWQKALEEIRKRMGISGKRVPFTSELFLEAVTT